ncbi:hypothetical protein SAMD00019534_000140, partial [Acytostelium subglobosum LB1]|uniref:hypothetical protein n=1 Tax=Acytostelium subglobosum LB1 TaxID=1410327 RepID=UPI000644D3D9
PKGQCNLPAPTQMSVAAVGIGFYSGGKRCGECYRVAGPKGSLIVMIIDVCNQGEECYQTDRAHFMLLNTDFYRIAPTNQTLEIYSLAYQQVSCEHEGNINATFNGGGDGHTDFAYYFRVSLYGMTVGIRTLQVMGLGMTGFQKMKYENGGFTWNKLDESVKFIFPGTLLITSFDNETVTYEFDKVVPFKVYDTHKQFTPIPSIDNSSTECVMGLVQQYIYDDHVLFGWDSYNSFNFSEYTVADTSDPFSGLSCIRITLNPRGGLTFSRDGGFATKYLQSISFAARSTESSTVRVFFGRFGGYVLSSKLNSQWQNFHIPVRDLDPSAIEYMITFYNNQDRQITFYFDNFKWDFTNDSPYEPSVNIDTTSFNPTTTSGSALNPATTKAELPTSLGDLFPTTTGGGSSNTGGTGTVTDGTPSTLDISDDVTSTTAGKTMTTGKHGKLSKTGGMTSSDATGSKVIGNQSYFNSLVMVVTVLVLST